MNRVKSAQKQKALNNTKNDKGLPSPSKRHCNINSDDDLFIKEEIESSSENEEDDNFSPNDNDVRHITPSQKKKKVVQSSNSGSSSCGEEEIVKPTTNKVNVTKSQQGKIKSIISQIPEANLRSLTCPQCTSGKKYTNQVNLYRHIKLVHKLVEKPYVCELCDQSYRLESLLKYHIERVHSGIRHPCPYCPKVYAGELQLTFHIRVHTGDGLHKCPKCSKSFPIKRRLEEHLTSHQPFTKETSVVCDTCGKELRDKFRLYQHKMKIHVEPEFECEICERRFRQKYQLRNHMDAHRDETPWKCVICFKQFKVQEYMLKHMKKYHEMSIKEAREVYDKHKDTEVPLSGADYEVQG